ncbi:hypothetical protein [Streptomyces sp. NPDC058757]|uniref:hypothetical protein n=1 Tax=Streptomyces sp. NPDC058757 TaxID=3346626 RepID=UPI0036BC5B82
MTYHCELYATAPSYRGLLRRAEAATPRLALRFLRQMAGTVADLLDDAPAPADGLERPSAPLRRWTEDTDAHEDLQGLLLKGKFVPEVVRAAGSDGVLYVLAAMPASHCPCRSAALLIPAPTGPGRWAPLIHH